MLKHSRDFNLTRESVLGSRLAPETPAYDVQQACGTGLETTILVANKIALGQIECGIAGGVDTTSDAPLALNEDLREVLLEVKRAKTNADRLRALAKIRPQQIVPEIPRNAEPRTGLSMGEHAAIMAREWGIGREEQDELAARSHHNLADGLRRAASSTTWWSPFLGLERDQNLRPDSSVEKLAKLRPVFGGPDGTMTAGNSTPLSDGASAVLLASEEWAAEHGIPVQAYITEAQTAAVDYVQQARGTADGAGLRDADDARAGRARRCRTSTSTRSTRRSPRRFCARSKAWEDPVFCRERLGLEAPLGAIERERLNVHGGSLGRRPPVRRHRRTHRRQPRQAARRTRLRPRRDLDLRRRRPRCHRDHGEGIDA